VVSFPDSFYVRPNFTFSPDNGAIGGAIGKNKGNSCGAIGNGPTNGSDWFNRKAQELFAEPDSTIGAFETDRPSQGFLLNFAGEEF
jgi:hypothetical protein